MANLHDAVELGEIGRVIGYDLFRYGRRIESDDSPLPILEGFAQARVSGLSQRQPDRFVRKWLQLRVNAYRRSRVVDPTITPAFIASIDVAVCPVTRVALTHGERVPTDWSIDRLNNDGAYAPNNLAVISTLANHAKGDRDFQDVLRLSRLRQATAGLQPEQWLRLAAIMLGPSFAHSPRLAPAIPLVAPIPSRSARPAVQVIQYVFTRHAARQSGKNALVKQFRAASHAEAATARLTRFAEALHQALKHAEVCWDAWLSPDAMRELSDWRASLTPSQWAHAGVIAQRIAAARLVGSEELEAWHLPHGGYFH